MSAVLPLNLRLKKSIDSRGSYVYPTVGAEKNGWALWFSKQDEICRESVWIWKSAERCLCLISKSHSTVLMQHFCHLSSRLDRPNKVFCQCALLPKVQVLVLAPTDVSWGIHIVLPEAIELFSLLPRFTSYTSKQSFTLFPSPEQAINHIEVYAKAIMRITDH